MATSELISAGQELFPELKIKYKNQSPLMKLIGKIAFFNPSFMIGYLTTIGFNVYVPDENYIANNSQAFTTVFIHELTHAYDTKRLGFLYNLGYLFPQILAPVSLLLLFILKWYMVLPIALFFLLPLPAPFRAYFEKRAYFVQMYAGKKIYDFDPIEDVQNYTDHLRKSDYYFMWPWEKPEAFAQEAVNVLAGNPSCSSEPILLNQVNTLIAAAQK